MYDQMGACRHRGGPLLRHPQPRLLRRLQFLFPGLSHQGRIISSTAMRSVVGEVTELTRHPGFFKGYIHDVGGPPPTSAGLPVKKQGGALQELGMPLPGECPNVTPTTPTI